MSASLVDGGSKDSVAVSMLNVPLLPLNAFNCHLPEAFLHPTSFSYLSFPGLQSRTLTSPHPLQTLQKRCPLTLSTPSYFCFLLIFSFYTWLLSDLVPFQGSIQLNPCTILLFTDTSNFLQSYVPHNGFRYLSIQSALSY